MEVCLISVLGGVVIILRVWFMKMLILVIFIIAFQCHQMHQGLLLLSWKADCLELVLLLEGKVSLVIQSVSQVDNHVY